MKLRAYKVELDLNNKQISQCEHYAWAAREVYNWALERRKEEYKKTGKSPSFQTQNKEFVRVKKMPEHEWRGLHLIPSTICEHAIKDLDTAYKNFFRGCKKGAFIGFPKRKKPDSPKKFKMRKSIQVTMRTVRCPGIGRIRMKQSGYIPVGSTVKQITISNRAGKWFASLLVEEEDVVKEPGHGDPIGVDWGISTLAVVSDGRQYKNAKYFEKSQAKLRRAQRKLARRKKGSVGRKKAKAEVAKIQYRIACQRNDATHKMTTDIIKTEPKPTRIVVEDLNVKGMMKNRKLSKNVADANPGEVKRQFEYKCSWENIEFVEADRWFPSSKLCHVCGHKKEDLKLNHRSWTCSNCKTRHRDRDLNAAINLSRYG